MSRLPSSETNRCEDELSAAQEICLNAESAASRPRDSLSRLALKCVDSVYLGLAVSLIVGLLYVLILLGPTPLNPRNIGWLGWDAAQGYIGWTAFRQDPHWHWPLTYTNRLGYPAGVSVALLDPNPLFVLPLKPFS